jgi:O-methyltransferase domain/Dimerisation domain
MPQPQVVPELPPIARIYQLAIGYRISRALQVVTELGIADFLKDGPKSAEALAAATQSNPDALFRILRALASLGVFAETSPREFALTALSETLRGDVPGSFRDVVLFLVEDLHWAVYEELGYSVRTGQPAFDHVFGQELWEYLSEHPEKSLLVDRAMAAVSGSMGPAIAEAYDFSKFQTIVDVGGGTGTLMAAILNKHPRPRGIVYDLPHAIERARAAGLLPNGRGELIAGDFFQTIPPGADAYLFKQVIHDWPDEKAQAILQQCHRAMTGAGTLLLFEQLIPPDSSPHPSKFGDIEMLILQNGRERTEQDFRGLLAGAGFRLDRIVPTKSAVSIIEASPVP